MTAFKVSTVTLAAALALASAATAAAYAVPPAAVIELSPRAQIEESLNDGYFRALMAELGVVGYFDAHGVLPTSTLEVRSFEPHDRLASYYGAWRDVGLTAVGPRPGVVTVAYRAGPLRGLTIVLTPRPGATLDAWCWHVDPATTVPAAVLAYAPVPWLCKK